MASNRMRIEETRRNAQELFAQAEKRQKDRLKEKDKTIAAMVSKTARLRSLRLAKEASDKEASDKEAAEQLAAKTKPKKPAANKNT
jgi:hypothetical protein